MEQDFVTGAVRHDSGAVLGEIDVSHSAMMAFNSLDRFEAFSRVIENDLALRLLSGVSFQNRK